MYSFQKVLLPAVLSLLLLLLLLPLLASLPMLYCMVFSCSAAQASTSGKSCRKPERWTCSEVAAAVEAYIDGLRGIPTYVPSMTDNACTAICILRSDCAAAEKCDPATPAAVGAAGAAGAAVAGPWRPASPDRSRQMIARVRMVRGTAAGTVIAAAAAVAPRAAVAGLRF